MGGVSGVQVVVQDPVDRCVPFIVGVVDVSQFGGVGPQEVVEGEPARRPFLEQVRTAQLGQQLAYLPLWDPGQACRGEDGKVGARVQPQQPEQPGRLAAEPLVGPGEDRTGVGGWVAAGERVQPASGVA